MLWRSSERQPDTCQWHRYLHVAECYSLKRRLEAYQLDGESLESKQVGTIGQAQVFPLQKNIDVSTNFNKGDEAHPKG